jgi:hypothetical protein
MDNQDKVKAAGGIELLVDLLKHRPDLYPERMKMAVDRLSSHLWNVVRHDNGVSNGLAKARDLNAGYGCRDPQRTKAPPQPPMRARARA